MDRKLVKQVLSKAVNNSNRLLMNDIADEILAICNDTTPYEEAVGGVRELAEKLKSGELPK